MSDSVSAGLQANDPATNGPPDPGAGWWSSGPGQYLKNLFAGAGVSQDAATIPPVVTPQQVSAATSAVNSAVQNAPAGGLNTPPPAPPPTLGASVQPNGNFGSGPNAGGLAAAPQAPPAPPQGPVDGPRAVSPANVPQGPAGAPLAQQQMAPPPPKADEPGLPGTQPMYGFGAPPAAPAAAPTAGQTTDVVSGFNYGNIRPADGSKGFNSYPTAQDGVAGMSQNLAAYQTQHGINTILGVTSRWAPKGDGANDPVAYAATVGKLTGIDPNAKIDLTDPAIQAKIIPAMAQVEQGKAINLPPQLLMAGIQQGLSGKVATAGTQFAGPGAPTGPTAPQVNTPAQQHQFNDVGLPPGFQMQPLPYPNAAQMPKGMAMMALGAGILGGRGFGNGMQQGMQNMMGVMQMDRQGQQQANQNTMELNRQGQQQAYQNFLASNATRKTDLTASTPAGPQQVMKAQDGTPQYFTPMKDGSFRQDNGPTSAQTGQVIHQQSVNQAGTALGMKYDGLIQANLTQQREAGKDAAEDIQKVQNGAAADAASKADLDTMDAQLRAHPDMMGSTIQAQATRALVSMGIIGDPSGLDAASKAATANRNAYVTSLAAGHGSGMPRSNQELQNIGKAVAEVGTNPDAQAWLVQTQKQELAARSAFRDQLSDIQESDDPAVQKQGVGSNYMRMKSQFFTNFFKDHPLPVYGEDNASAPASSPAAPAPAAPPAPGGTRGVTKSGVQWSVNP